VFVGKTGFEAGIMLKGKLTHRRTINSKYGTSDLGWLQRHVDPRATRYEEYLLPLDDEMAEQVELLSKPYPHAPQAETSLRRLPVWRGRGSTERGAPIMSHIGMPARSARIVLF
jgi:hypothetical protein